MFFFNYEIILAWIWRTKAHGGYKDNSIPTAHSGYSYGPPASEYIPPSSTEYGQPPSEYGPPSFGGIINSYGPAPTSSAPPSSSYGPPTPTYGPPFSGYHYGPPSFAPRPSVNVYNYGPPPQKFPIIHSAPRDEVHWLLDKFKFKLDLFTIGKILLKLIIFKKIVKFIALICLLLFLPRLQTKPLNVVDMLAGGGDESEEEIEEKRSFSYGKFIIVCGCWTFFYLSFVND